MWDFKIPRPQDISPQDLYVVHPDGFLCSMVGSCVLEWVLQFLGGILCSRSGFFHSMVGSCVLKWVLQFLGGIFCSRSGFFHSMVGSCVLKCVLQFLGGIFGSPVGFFRFWSGFLWVLPFHDGILCTRLGFSVPWGDLL